MRSIMPVWDGLGMLWGPMTAVWLVERGKQSKTYGLVFSLYAVNRVGSFHSPTLLYQQTNRYAVVNERALDVLCTSIIYTARGGFSYIVKHSCTL